MAKRRDSQSRKKQIEKRTIPVRITPVDMYRFATVVPLVIASFEGSFVKQAQKKIDWSLYDISKLYRGNPYIVREMCDRCGKVWVYPNWRKVRVYHDEELGDIYFETGLCKTCINASVYVDKYLDGNPLTEVEAKDLFYKYAAQYEATWKNVLKVAPLIMLSESDWQRACDFFNGCAFCGDMVESRMMYFPQQFGGAHTAWNVLPVCGACQKNRRVGNIHVFSSREQFNKAKTARMYLLNQMRRYKIYMEPLEPFMERFYETKILEGS